jgi:hypothetical protein
MSADPAASEPSLTVVISAPAPEPSGRIPWIEVELHLSHLEASRGAPLLHLPLVLDNVEGVAGVLQELSAIDAHGALRLAFADTTSASEADRTWSSSERPVAGGLTVRYRVPISDVPNVRGAAPAYELRSEGGAFSGLGSMFIMQPEAREDYRLEIRWHFATRDALGVSSFGVGDVLAPPGPAERLGRAYFMGGHLGRYPLALPKAGGFLGSGRELRPMTSPA